MEATPAPTSPTGTTEKLPFPLQGGETVLKLCRQHWWFLWPALAVKLVVLVGGIVLVWVVFDLAGADTGVGEQFLWVVSLIWGVYWGARAFLGWYRYQHDLWVITNQRIVDSNKNHPFDLRVSSADLVNVQDISVERRGILPTTLDFGDIVCQTSGSSEAFRLAGLPDPRTTQALIDQERDRERMRIRGGA